MSVITDVETAMALIDFETSDDSAFVYSEYLEANGVTLETVKDHVQALANIAFPKEGKGTEWQPAARKYFCTKIRNGLNYQLGKGKAEKAVTVNLLTPLGLEEFAGMTSDEIVAHVLAEIADRAK